MKSILTIKVKAPKLIPSKNRLHTYGTLEMGDVPKALFVMNAIAEGIDGQAEKEENIAQDQVVFYSSESSSYAESQ